MSGYLTHLATRTLEPAKSLRPELPSIFAAPRTAADSPFELNISLHTAGAAQRSNVTNNRARSQTAPSTEFSGDPEGMEADQKKSMDNDGASAQRRITQSSSRWGESARDRGEIPPPEDAVTSQPIEDVALPAASLRMTHAALESASKVGKNAPVPKSSRPEKDAAPQVTVSPSATKAQMGAAVRPGVPGQAGTEAGLEERVNSPDEHLGSQTATGRVTAEPKSNRFARPFSADGKKLDSRREAPGRTTLAEDIAKLRHSPLRSEADSDDSEVRSTGHLWPTSSSRLPGRNSPLNASVDSVDSIVAGSAAALGESRRVVSSSGVPAHLRSLGQAGAQAPRSKGRPDPATEPAIQVTIGRIEVRAPSTQTSAKGAQRTFSNGPSLETYLRARSQRGQA